MIDLFLGETKFTVNGLKLFTNCPKFEDLKLLPYRVQSASGTIRSTSLFRRLAARTGPHEGEHELAAFALRRVRVCGSSFQSLGVPWRASVIHHEIGRRAGEVEEQNLQQD
jgi:hypothetical protein